ncbi:hypothetical protein [uncultured Sulfitobacter sp.]|uniref:hypothetical protein n=1 Tax=uncultured Sulfitobacter sp. TaxID=191468 RepID=UPI00260C689D|nr:hypothetical protein [uncultured Sulfitobacter sp.]
MPSLITPDTISFRAHVSEDELRERMAQEVLEQIGALNEDGKPAIGVEAKVRRGTGRTGGYTIEVTGPAPARIMLPKGDAR